MTIRQQANQFPHKLSYADIIAYHITQKTENTPTMQDDIRLLKIVQESKVKKEAVEVKKEATKEETAEIQKKNSLSKQFSKKTTSLTFVPFLLAIHILIFSMRPVN